MSHVSGFEKWWLNSRLHRWHVRRQVPKFLKTCPEPVRGEVLEVGAGQGWTSRQILETFPQVELTATDIDGGAMGHFEQLQHKYGDRLRLKQADANHLPFDRNAFDMGIALYVMHHLDDLPAALRQMIRVTKPGGLIGVADEDMYSVVGLPRAASAKRFTRPEVEQILRDEGCEILVAEGTMPYILWARVAYPVTPQA